MASPRFPEPPPTFPPTPLAEVDAAVARLHANKDRWLTVSTHRRATLLERCMAGLRGVCQAWADATNRNRGLDPTSAAGAEPWLTELLPTMRNLRLLRDAMKAGGQPKVPAVRSRPDGQLVAQVLPVDGLDKALFTGISAEVWLTPGKPATQGKVYRDKRATGANPGAASGAVCLVLGAGNVGSIAPTDVLYKLFVEDEVVVLKTNPVNAYLGPMWEATLRPLIDEGFCAVVHGGVEVGQHLTAHPQVDTLHITGSDKTHDAIVWGTGAEGAANKAKGTKANAKPMASELGCVTPVLVVPGPWSESDLRYHARGVASMVTNNASFNCLAAKAVVVARGWPLRERFLRALREALAEVPARKAYYPGATARWRRFCEAYPDHVTLGPPVTVDEGDPVVPWTVLPEVAPSGDEVALSEEAFCGVLAEVTLECDDARTFLVEAVRFANEQAWGNLSCVVLLDGKTAKALPSEVDRAIADLRYGGVAVNAFPGLIFAMATTTWGAFPGNTDTDIRSGKGVVHNALLLDHPQKSVLRAPFRIVPTPVWFEGHRQALAIGRKMVELEDKRSWRKVPGVVRLALRG